MKVTMTCLQNKTRGQNIQVFVPGDKVYYKNQTVNSKFSWCKGTVLKRIGKVIYLIKDDSTSKIQRKHKNQIILFKSDDCKTKPKDTDIDIEELTGDPTLEIQDQNSADNMAAESPQGTLPLPSPDQSGGEKEYEEACSGSPSPGHLEEAAPDQQTVEPPPIRRSRRNLPSVNYKVFY
ncbi:uncharacterized protein LOC113507416 [Trichoplusia ni]|uniref:Uncharacterized protein LOC113507416 n=1 Tax=Trichoplusia ni TaxID=7111 RepID=A0A7E5X0S4_TRINI|nr:uncharacterized protein LOC113507416 [Trichoplusia ni]